MAKTTPIKTTLDGRKLECVGLAICLDGELEAFELIDIRLHPNGRNIHKAAPEARYLAGRVTLTFDEADAVRRHMAEVEAEIRADPKAMAERFRIAMMWRARELGIE
jgi:hypothetical protein